MRCALLLLLLATSSVVVAVATGCSSAPPPPLKQSCATRSTWKQLSEECATCVTQTTRMRCDCDTSPAAGACFDLNVEYGRSPDCGASVGNCVTACNGDCTCIDGCYTAHATCRTLAEKLQGCIVQACDTRCR